MRRMTTLQKVGITILIVSFLAGLIGTVWRIYLSFTALDSAEVAGLAPVSDRIANAIIFTAGGLIGSGIGLTLFILGRRRPDAE